jgi:hypothetical protein
MTIVETDNDIVLPVVLENVRQVVVGLARHIDPIIADDVFLTRDIVARKASGELDTHIGNPLSANLDKSIAQLGKSLRDAIVDDRVKGRKHRHFETRKTILPLEQLHPIKVSRGSMNTNRQIRHFRHLVQRKEIGMAEALVVDKAAAEDAASSMGFGKAHLRHSACHIDHGNDSDPTQPAFPFAANINEPLVVASADGLFYFQFGS